MKFYLFFIINFLFLVIKTNIFMRIITITRIITIFRILSLNNESFRLITDLIRKTIINANFIKLRV